MALCFSFLNDVKERPFTVRAAFLIVNERVLHPQNSIHYSTGFDYREIWNLRQCCLKLFLRLLYCFTYLPPLNISNRGLFVV